MGSNFSSCIINIDHSGPECSAPFRACPVPAPVQFFSVDYQTHVPCLMKYNKGVRAFLALAVSSARLP